MNHYQNMCCLLTATYFSGTVQGVCICYLTSSLLHPFKVPVFCFGSERTVTQRNKLTDLMSYCQPGLIKLIADSTFFRVTQYLQVLFNVPCLLSECLGATTTGQQSCSLHSSSLVQYALVSLGCWPNRKKMWACGNYRPCCPFHLCLHNPA